jgi:Ca-activated chloride channel family protein
MNLSWVHPWALLLLLLLPLGVLWARRTPPPALAYPRAGAVGRGGVGVRLVAALPGALRVLAMVALVLALARPRAGSTVVEEQTEGVPIVVALDVSSSMLAADFHPENRLAVAKQTIGRFIAGRESDPIALVAFAGEALTQVPLTTDHRVLLGALRNLRVGQLEDGTAMGDGLATALTRLRDVQAPSKVVILMSDGENNRGRIAPLEAARAAATLGVRVFTIGVGSRGVAPVPVRAADGRIVFVNEPVSIDEPLMTEMAELTGGQYFRATSPDALREVYARIDALVKSPVEVRRYERYRELYLPLLWIAAALLVAEWVVRGRWGVVE